MIDMAVKIVLSIIISVSKLECNTKCIKRKYLIT